MVRDPQITVLTARAFYLIDLPANIVRLYQVHARNSANDYRIKKAHKTASSYLKLQLSGKRQERGNYNHLPGYVRTNTKILKRNEQIRGKRSY